MSTRTPSPGKWTAVVTVTVAMALQSAGLRAEEPAAGKHALATGAFIQMRRHAERPAEWWDAELAAMKRLGMDTVVVSEVAKTYINAIENVMLAADRHGLKVYLGFHMDRNQYRNGTFDLSVNLTQANVEFDDLQSRYGKHQSLAGWYMPQEISDYMVMHQPQLRDSIVAYTKALTDRAHAESNLPMLISPFFGQNANTVAYAEWWDKTGLPQTGVDIVALQDGMGTHRTSLKDAVTVFEALEPVMSKHNVELWGNSESFNQIHGWPVDDEPWAAQPANPDDFVLQITSTRPFVSKVITFEFCTYMSPQGTPAARSLYSKYQAYIEQSNSRTAPKVQLQATPD